MYIWNKWRWFPDTYDYKSKGRLKNLKIVYNVLQNRVKHENANFKDLYVDCAQNISFIKDSTFNYFFSEVIYNYVKGGELFTCIWSIWPSEKTLNIYKKSNNDKWKALEEFKNDFLRDRRPIFNMIIENKSNHDIVLNKVRIEMRNLEVDMMPKAFGGGQIQKEGEYNWDLTNLDDIGYNKWLKEKNNKFPYGFKEEYKQDLLPTNIILSNKLRVPSKGFSTFKVRINSGFIWPCELKFLFYSTNNDKVTSDWLKFKPVSHPEINIYSFN